MGRFLRTKPRIHLSTAVFLMLSASVMAGLDVYCYRSLSEYPTNARLYAIVLTVSMEFVALLFIKRFVDWKSILRSQSPDSP